MNYCSQCGAPLGIGRFCTNCGARIVASTTPAHTAAPAEGAPTPVRGPVPEPLAEQTLVYDVPPAAAAANGSTTGPALPPEADSGVPAAPAPAVGPAAAPAATPPTPPPASGDRSGGPERRATMVAIVAVVLLALLVAVAWLARGGDPRDTVASDRGDAKGSGVSSGSGSGATGPLVDVAADATISAPAPIPPGRDLAGNPIPYAATNVTDGDTTTAYRLRGDATGTVVTFTWAQPTTVHEVGLVNGYAKTDSANGVAVNWYAANRKVLLVRWTFDDGTSVEQQLRPDPDWQLTDVPGVTTRSVRLEILRVSPPGEGRRSRDVTALSEVVLRAG